MIYLDNAATTKMRPEVFEAMRPYLLEEYGNPATVYRLGLTASEAVKKAREQVADLIGAEPDEIYFTSGGSESDNWALKGVADYWYPSGKRHFITTKIEHHAILNTCGWLESGGFDITYLDVDKEGKVDPGDVEKAIRPKDTCLISIMTANNEIGTIEPIEEIGKIARENKILFHTDAVQAVGHIPINVKRARVDLLSASAHKFHGPKGVGFLYIKKGTKISSFIHGGNQENGLRAGTSNVAGIVGLGKAAELVKKTDPTQMIQMRDRLISSLREIPGAKIMGSLTDRLPNNVDVCFEGVSGETLGLYLDGLGICVSTGSACTTGSLTPSHVLTAMGVPEELAHGSLRLTLSEETTLGEIEYTVDSIKKGIEFLRDAF